MGFRKDFRGNTICKINRSRYVGAHIRPLKESISLKMTDIKIFDRLSYLRLIRLCVRFSVATSVFQPLTTNSVANLIIHQFMYGTVPTECGFMDTL